MNAIKILQDRFKGRLVLKDNYLGAQPSIVDRVVKNAKEKQLNPEYEEKWTHDRAEEPPRQKKAIVNHRRDSTPEVEEVEEKPKPTQKSNDKMNKVLVRNLPNDVSETQVKKIF